MFKQLRLFILASLLFLGIVLPIQALEIVSGIPTENAQNITNPNIDGGTIDSTVIGGTTSAAGTFTDLLGLVPVITISANTVLTAAQCKGQIILITGNYTATLPAVVIGGLVTLRATTAAVFYGKANANDRIILSGVALDDGDKTASPGNAGDQITYWGDSAAGWTVVGMIGGHTDGGV